MEKAKKIKLFGVEIPVSEPPSEYPSTPTTGGRPTLSLLDQENRAHHDQNNVAADNPCYSDDISRKSPAKKRAFDEIHGCDNIIEGGSTVCKNLMPFKKRFSATVIFPAQVGCSHGSRSSTPLPPKVRLLPKDRSPRPDDDDVSRKNSSKKTAFDEIHSPSSSSSTCGHGVSDDSKVYSPMPLRFFPPMNMIFSAGVGFSRKKACQEKKKAKSNENKKKSKSRGCDKPIPPVLPLEEIPGLIQTIESHNGTTPVFLYKKELQTSDVRSHLNRLFISGRKNKESLAELRAFLSEEEKAAITDDKTRKGLDFVGIDKKGESYNLRLTTWGSLTMIVINKAWMKMVSANNAEKGDWVELWGYRVNNTEFRLVINFRKTENRIIADGSSTSGSSTTNVGGMIMATSP